MEFLDKIETERRPNEPVVHVWCFSTFEASALQESKEEEVTRSTSCRYTVDRNIGRVKYKK